MKRGAKFDTVIVQMYIILVSLTLCNPVIPIFSFISFYPIHFSHGTVSISLSPLLNFLSIIYDFFLVSFFCLVFFFFFLLFNSLFNLSLTTIPSFDTPFSHVLFPKTFIVCRFCVRPVLLHYSLYDVQPFS